jgi:hypothetical protein
MDLSDARSWESAVVEYWSMDTVRVYLDSSDFSKLSDVRLESSLVHVLEVLRSWTSSGRIVCYFTGIHLSEMAPLDTTHADAAERRADLLVELCGKNALISPDRLIKWELQYAMHEVEGPPDVQSSSAEWYPDGVDQISPASELKLAASLDQAAQSIEANRKTRRALKRYLLKDGRLTNHARNSMRANARTHSLNEILDMYPMRSEDARVLTRYVVGDASEADARAAFIASLQDPRWMMRWFEKHHTQLSPFISWIRAPSSSMVESVATVAREAAKIRQADSVAGSSFADGLLSASSWGEWQNRLLLGTASRLAKGLLDRDTILSVELIDERCPGLSVGVRSLHTAWRTSTTEVPRRSKPSDFPDALHAMYAPYVDVFRSDAFMAPHIARFAKRFGTCVVAKLTDLPHAISSAFERNSV